MTDDMTEPTSARRVVRFGDVELHLNAGEVFRKGRRVPLPDQPLRILVRLLERPGEIISRDDLRRELWSDDTFVDFEHGLNSAIKRLRDALGDSANDPRYVETMPRRGYRFIGRLSGEQPHHTPTDRAEVTDAQAERSKRLRHALWVIAAVLVAAVATVGAWKAITKGASGRSTADTPNVTANRILVSPISKGAADEARSSLGRLAAERIIAVLSELEDVDVVPESVVTGSVENGATAARHAGAALAIVVSSYTDSPGPLLNARILDSRTNQPLYFSPRISGASHHDEAAVEQLAQAVGGAIAVHFDYAFGGLHITSSPPVLEAYLEYRRGSELLERDYPRAIGHLRRASSISPGFLLPKLTLVMAYDNLGDRASTSQQMSEIADASERLSKAERLLVEYMTESLARRPADALRALMEAEKIAPHSWIINYGIQQEAVVLNRPRVGIEAFARFPLHDRYRRFNGWRLGMLARTLHLTGDYGRELVEITRAQEYQPGNLMYVAGEARALAALGRTEALFRLLDASQSKRWVIGEPAAVMEQAARELRRHGFPQQSLAVAVRGIEWLRARPPSEWRGSHRPALARMFYLAERWDEAQSAFERLALESPDSVDYAGYLGAIAARQKDVARAVAASEKLRRLSSADLFGRHTFWRACIASLLGERERAVSLLRDSFGQGQYQGLRVHQAPEFESIWSFPPFIELLKPRE